MVNQINQELSALGHTPIAETAPAGNSIQYDPEFERLDEEIRKLQALTPTPVDWADVVRVGVSILSNKSKDLKVASYLCVGLFEQDKYRGLATGFTIVRDLVKEYWETGYPEQRRFRARVAALTWLVERLVRRLPQEKPSVGDQAAIEHVLDLTLEIEKLVSEKLGKDTLSFGELRRALIKAAAEISNKTKVQESQELPAPSAVKETAPPPPPSIPQYSSPAEINSDTEAQRILRACQSQMSSLASYYRHKNLADPQPYRLLRISTWLNVDRLPPSEGGITQIRVLSGERKEKLQQMLAAEEYEALIPEAENAFSRAPFWLDAHRLTAAALEALGSSYARAHKAVIESLKEFLQRFPGLVELKSMEGGPFADELTRGWIQREVLAPNIPFSVHQQPPLVESEGERKNAPWMACFEEAKGLAGKGKIQEGLQLFKTGWVHASSSREHFMWELMQARYCFETGHFTVAISQLEYLDNQIERFSLEEWDPDLSLEVARLLLLCHHRLGEKSHLPERQARMARLHTRLCRLDASAAVGLTKD
jgi:type VI secretion system protein VasJ